MEKQYDYKDKPLEDIPEMTAFALFNSRYKTLVNIQTEDSTVTVNLLGKGKYIIPKGVSLNKVFSSIAV